MYSVKKKGIVIGKVTDGNVTVISGNCSSFFSKLNVLLLFLLLLFGSCGVNFVDSFGMNEDEKKIDDQETIKIEKIEKKGETLVGKKDEGINTSTKVQGGDVSACDSQDIGLGKAYNDVSKSCKEVLEECKCVKKKVVNIKNEIQRRQNNILNTGHEGYYCGVDGGVYKDNELKIESGGKKYFNRGCAVQPKYVENSDTPLNEKCEIDNKGKGTDEVILKYVLGKGVNTFSRDIMCDSINEELFNRSYVTGFQKRDLGKDIKDRLDRNDNNFKEFLEGTKQHETEFNGQYNKKDGSAYEEVLGSMKAAFGVEEEKKVEGTSPSILPPSESDIKDKLVLDKEIINQKKEKEKEEEKNDHGLLKHPGVDRLSGLQQSMNDIICLESMTEGIEDTIKTKNDLDQAIRLLKKIRDLNQDDKEVKIEDKIKKDKEKKIDEKKVEIKKEEETERKDVVDVGSNGGMKEYQEKLKDQARVWNLDYDKGVLSDVPGGLKKNQLFNKGLITIKEEGGKVSLSLEGLEKELKGFEQEAEGLKEAEKKVNDTISKLRGEIENIEKQLNEKRKEQQNNDSDTIKDAIGDLSGQLNKFKLQILSEENDRQAIEVNKKKLMGNVDGLCGLIVAYTENNVTRLLYMRASCFIRRYDFSIKRNNNANVNMFCVDSFGPLYNLLRPLVKKVEDHRESRLPRFLFKRTLFFTLGSIISGIGGEVNNWKPLYRGNWFSLNMYRSRIFTSYGVNLQINNLPVINTLTVHVIGIHFIPLILGGITCLLTSGFVKFRVDLQKERKGFNWMGTQIQKEEFSKKEVLGTNIFGTIRDLCYSFKHAIGKLSIGGFKECMFHCIGSYMRGVECYNINLCDIGYLLTRRLLFDSIQICSISIPVHEYVSININLGSVLLQGIMYLIYRLMLTTPRYYYLLDKAYNKCLNMESSVRKKHQRTKTVFSLNRSLGLLPNKKTAEKQEDYEEDDYNIINTD